MHTIYIIHISYIFHYTHLYVVYITYICIIYNIHLMWFSYRMYSMYTIYTMYIMHTLVYGYGMFSGVTAPTASELKPNERPQQPSLHDLPSNVDRARPHQTLVRDRLLHSYDSSVQLTRSHSIILDG